MIVKKRIARVIAVKICYAFFASGDKKDNVKEGVISLLNKSFKRYDEDLVELITQKCFCQFLEYRQLIQKFLESNYSVASLDLTKVAILFCAIAELKHNTSLQTVIIIHEYVSLSSCFVKDQDVGFINGILDKIASSVRQK